MRSVVLKVFKNIRNDVVHRGIVIGSKKCEAYLSPPSICWSEGTRGVRGRVGNEVWTSKLGEGVRGAVNDCSEHEQSK